MNLVSEFETHWTDSSLNLSGPELSFEEQEECTISVQKNEYRRWKEGFRILSQLSDVLDHGGGETTGPVLVTRDREEPRVTRKGNLELVGVVGTEKFRSLCTVEEGLRRGHNIGCL